jgi:hypothetical protein
MKFPQNQILIRTAVCSVLIATAAAQEAKSLFNGKDLNGWTGLTEFWSVKDGCITGQTTNDHKVLENTFLIYQAEEFGDFELTLKYKITDFNGASAAFGNSGIQYRSKIVKPDYFVVSGYQADFECGKTYSGILYEEKGRGILAKRGQKVVIREGETQKKPKIEVIGEVGKTDEIQAAIHPADWNDYKIVAKGGHLQHFINGVMTVDVTDETTAGAKTGVIALQLHSGPTGMTVQFKDLQIKKL